MLQIFTAAQDFLGGWPLGQLPLTVTSLADTEAALITLAIAREVLKLLLVALPVIVGALIVYFFIRKAGAEEQEVPMWAKRIKGGFITVALGEAATSLVLYIVTNYSSVRESGLSGLHMYV